MQPKRHPQQIGRRTFYAVIGQAPICGPADHATALAFVHRIESCLLDTRWSEYDRQRLRALRQTWRRRAEGRDPRFEIAGTRDGRLTADVEYLLRPQQQAAQIRAKTDPNGAPNLARSPNDQRLKRARHERALDAIDLDLPNRIVQ